MSLPEKLKCSLFICCLDRNQKSKIELGFAKNYFTIHFIEPLKEENQKEIKEIFSPFLTRSNRLIKINYIYIKNIYADNSKLLKFTLHNPKSTSAFTIIFNHFKYKKSLFSEINIPSSILPSIALDINKKVIYLTEKKINDYINMIHLLYQFISTERKYNELIEKFFLNAFIFGKNYYDKCLKDFNLNDKKYKKSISEQSAREINKYISEMKIEKESNNKINLINFFRGVNKSSSSIEEEDEEKSKNNDMINKLLINNGIDNSEVSPKIYSALEIDSNNKRDLFQNYEKFKKFFPDIKIEASYFSEITINLIFKMLNVDKIDLNNKYNFMNKSAIGIRINIKNNNLASSIYQNTQTNYNYNYKINTNIKNGNFEDKNGFERINNFIKKYSVYEPNLTENSDKFIKELLNFSHSFHNFVPNNSIQNIITNTAQVIHRKFFELLFKYYFSDIMDIESEKNKALGSEFFHLILKVLRRLKKILFTQKNINYFNDFLFLQEQ